MNAKSSLPPLYARWMDELLGGPAPEETEATCLDCPMCSRDPARNKSGVIFNEVTKCCTYMPDLPNYLVGAIYLNEDPSFAAGKAAFQAQLRKGLVITPLGMFPPPEFLEKYKLNIQQFGHNVELRCPYYLNEAGGLCGIWKHRNSRCATWFCRYIRGSSDVIFWKYVDQLLSAVEKALTRWCVLQLDIGYAAMQRLFPPPPTQRTINDMPWMWGNWYGRERQFYEECARLVEPLNWLQVREICGAEIQVFSRVVYHAYAAMQRLKLPERLRIGNWKKAIVVENDMVRIWAYNYYDPMDLPKTIAEALPVFQDRTLADAQATLQKKGIAIEEPLLRKLIDFGVLIPA